MNSPNTQKTITVFLILAALTSSFVFLLSKTNVGSPLIPADQGAQSVTLGGKSVFVESPSALPSFNSPLLARSDLGSSASGAVTNNFTDQLLQRFMAANPDGPNLASKNPLVLPKNFDDLGGMSDIVSVSFEPQLQNKNIKISQKYSAEDIFNYLTATRSALEDILAPGIAQLSDRSLTLQSLGDISEMYDRAENKIYQTSVPAPFSRFNRALLGFVDVQRAFFDQTDPAKTLIALRNPKMVLAPYQEAVALEAKNLGESLPKLLGALGQQDKAPGIIGAILGIQKAYAFSDWIGGPSNIINAILKALSNVVQSLISQLTNVEFYKKLLTEYLKNILVKKLAAQTIQWVQGGGKPQFVQNWKSFLGDSFNTAVSGVISKYAPGLCSTFRPLVKVALTPVQVGYNALNNPYACTPERIAGNFQDLQNSFADGGWVTYGYMLQPNNNFYGSLVQLSAASNQAGSQSQEASKNSASAASGFLSSKDCKDKITVTPAEVGGGISSVSDARGAFGDNFISCSDTSCSSITLCNPNNANAWQETTPGKLVSDTLSKNLGGSPLERIVNAQDLEGLVNSLINSALSKLVALGQKGLSNLTADKLAADTGTLGDTCKDLTGTALSTCLAESDSASSTVSSPAGSTKSIVVSKIQNVLKFKSQLLEEANTIVSPIDQTLAALDTASSTCSAVLNPGGTLDAANTLSFIDQSTDQLRGERIKYQNITNDLAPTSTPNPDRSLAHLNDILDHLQNGDHQWVATDLGMTIPTTGDEQGRKEQFYNNLSNAIDNPGSAFANLFGTLESASSDLGDAKLFETTLTVKGSCGILEKAKGLYELLVDGDPSCSIAVVNTACHQ